MARRWLARVWDALTRKPACARCGAPAEVLGCEMVGRLHTKDAAGLPVTKMYVRGAEWLCRACHRGNARDAADRSERD
jgi:hypothetical protein